MSKKHLIRSKRREPSPKRPRFKGADDAALALGDAHIWGAAALREFAAFPMDPRPEHSWTKNVPGYEKARASIEPALLQTLARTKAFRGLARSENREVDSVLFRVSQGELAQDSPEVRDMIPKAHAANRTHIFKELADAVTAAGKLEPKVLRFPEGQTVDYTRTLARDLNMPQLYITIVWVRELLWLMANEDIAAHMVNAGALPSCDRATVSRVIADLKLVRHPKPCVMSGQHGKLNIPWEFQKTHSPPDYASDKLGHRPEPRKLGRKYTDKRLL